MDFKATDIAAITKGVLIRGYGEARISGVSTDSRRAARGDIFFALKGPNFDGGRFVADVALKGAHGAVIEKGTEKGTEAATYKNIPNGFFVIEVDDTLSALGALAGHIRRLYKTPVVAISGSAGKTTTREMIASVLGRGRKVLKTEGNKNNLIGLPLTLFGLDATHGAAVLELGISEPWEMERLVGICAPDVAVITNIGRGHLKTLKNLEGVANAKAPLFTMLGKDAVRAVNLDDVWVSRIAARFGNNVTYGRHADADVRIVSATPRPGGIGTDAEYDVRGRRVKVSFGMPGEANAINGAGAIAALMPFKVSDEDIMEGLRSFRPAHGRMEVLNLSGFTVIDDTYNANPESVGVSLKTLSGISGRRVALLGEMLELGDVSEDEHRRVGAVAAALGIDVIVAVGGKSALVVEGAVSGGKLEGVYGFVDKTTAIEGLKSIVKYSDTVLVKGSRGERMEDVVEALKALAPD